MEERISKQEKKRLEELNFFRQFIELSDLQIQDYNQPVSDPPDISGKIGKDTFSMEITKLFNINGEKLIQRQKLIDRITKKLNTKSESDITNNFGVFYKLKKEIKINKKEEDNLVDSMIRIVQQKVDGNPDKIYRNFKVAKDELPTEVSKFELRRFEGIEEKCWYTRNFWMSGPISIQILCEILTTKIQSTLKNGYYKKYDQNWLLLVVENQPYSDFTEYRLDLPTIDNNVFSKVYILEKFENKLIELT